VPSSILIVDHSASVRMSLLRWLAGRAQFSPAQAVASAEIALELMRPSSGPKPAFDLLICGLNLPGMSGIELIEELRRRFGVRRPVTVVVSADSDDPALRAVLRALGVRHVLAKPVIRRQLLAAVEHALVTRLKLVKG